LAAFFTNVFAGFVFRCLCLLTAFLAGDFVATAFLAVFLVAGFFAFFAFLAVALTVSFFTFFALFAFIAFLGFTGIGPAPQFDDFLSEDLTIKIGE
jgi:hypothetical protein